MGQTSSDTVIQSLKADVQELNERLKEAQNKYTKYKRFLTAIIVCFAAYILFDLKGISVTEPNSGRDWEEVHECEVLKEKAEKDLMNSKHEIQRLNSAYLKSSQVDVWKEKILECENAKAKVEEELDEAKHKIQRLGTASSAASDQADVWKAKAHECKDSKVKLEEELYQLIDEKQQLQIANLAMSNQKRERIQDSKEKINLEEELSKAMNEIQRLHSEYSVKSNEADAWKQKVRVDGDSKMKIEEELSKAKIEIQRLHSEYSAKADQVDAWKQKAQVCEDSKIKVNKQLEQMNQEMQQLRLADSAKSAESQRLMQKINELTMERGIMDQKNEAAKEESYNIWPTLESFKIWSTQLPDADTAESTGNQTLIQKKNIEEPYNILLAFLIFILVVLFSLIFCPSEILNEKKVRDIHDDKYCYDKADYKNIK